MSSYTASTSASRSKSRRVPASSQGPAYQTHPRPDVDNMLDNTSEQRRHDRQLENDAGRDVIDHDNVIPGSNSGRAPPPEVQAKPISALSDIGDALTKSYLTMEKIKIPILKFRDTNWYMPTCFVLFEILAIMDRLIAHNEELLWQAPDYFSLPVRVYYAVLFYVQILRAKEQAGSITYDENSWLRNFLRKYKETSLPIAGPLIAFFVNLTACLPDNAQFDYVSPEMPTEGTYYVTSTTVGENEVRTLNVRPTHHIFPSLPLLLSLFKKFCSSEELTDQDFDRFGNYVPTILNSTIQNQPFAGINFPAHTQGTENPVIAALLNNPAISHPFPDGKARIIDCHARWRNSAATRIPDIPITGNYNPTSVADITMISGNPKWFADCVEMANAHARFFTNQTNLSHIPAVGDVSSLVVSAIEIEDHPTIPRTVNHWYPNTFDSLDARFEAYSSDLELSQQRAAAFALTNSVINWVTPEGHKIGSYEAGHRGGSYFRDPKPVFKSTSAESILANARTNIQTQFYRARPNTN